MFAVLAVVTVLVFFASAGLALRPARRHLLYAYAVVSTWTWLIVGYYDTTGYLGTGKSWSFLELMLLCVIFPAWLTSQPAPLVPKARSVDLPMKILTVLVGLSFVLGSLRSDTSGVLGAFKRFMFIPVYFVAVRILADPKAVQGLFKAVKIFVIPTFIVHALLAARVFVPPLPESAYDRLVSGYAGMARVESLMSPAFYLVAIAVCLTQILYRRPGVVFNWVILSLSVVGVLLSQTRSYYVGMAALVVAALVMLRGRIKLAVLIGLGFLVAFVAINVFEVELFFRFRHEVQQESMWYRYRYGARGQEYGILADTFKSEPQWLLTGRGQGAMRRGPGTTAGHVNYYHNQYLQVFDSLGLIGLLCHLAVVGGCVFRNRFYSRDPVAGSLLSPSRLIFMAMLPMEIFWGVLWWPATGPLLLCFIAIARNGDQIAGLAYESEYAPYALDDDYALTEDAPAYAPA